MDCGRQVYYWKKKIKEKTAVYGLDLFNLFRVNTQQQTSIDGFSLVKSGIMEDKHSQKKFHDQEKILQHGTTHWEIKESQTGSPKRAIWLSLTQLSMQLNFGATLYRRAVSEQKKGPIWLSMKHDYEEKKWLSPTKESRFSKLLTKRAIFGSLFLFSVLWLLESFTSLVSFETGCRGYFMVVAILYKWLCIGLMWYLLPMMAP